MSDTELDAELDAVLIPTAQNIIDEITRRLGAICTERSTARATAAAAATVARQAEAPNDAVQPVRRIKAF
jgi:hypothetical protein